MKYYKIDPRLLGMSLIVSCLVEESRKDILPLIYEGEYTEAYNELRFGECFSPRSRIVVNNLAPPNGELNLALFWAKDFLPEWEEVYKEAPEEGEPIILKNIPPIPEEWRTGKTTRPFYETSEGETTPLEFEDTWVKYPGGKWVKFAEQVWLTSPPARRDNSLQEAVESAFL